MKIDDFSLAFNCPGCPSWGTAVVEQDSQMRHLIKKEEASNVLLAMIHNQVPYNIHDFCLPIGKGGRVYYGDTGFDGATSEPILVSVFSKTKINGKIVDSPFVLVLIKDRTEDHKGRLQLKYSPKICYGDIKNEAFFKKATAVLGISESTPIMVYDIDAEDQETLEMTALYGDSIDEIRKEVDLYLVKNFKKAQKVRIDIINELPSFSDEDLINIANSWYKEKGPNAIRIFGIKFGAYFVENNISVSKFISKCKDINESYETELSKGIQIYKSIKTGEYGLFFYDDYYRQSAYKLTSENPIQLIYFGAPGTSKSNTIKKKIGYAPQHRITFHPDTDYSSFVGCYKPTKEKYSDQITYKFVAQTFLKAYIEAWKKFVSDEVEDKRVFLVIEEINRGNCAQIFGDLFQLLDRDENGYSDYTIEPDDDLKRYLNEEAFKDCSNIPEDIRYGNVLRLPPNLYIWATMNTSDQSLFPIDSAFKRRWEWKYLPIKNDNKGHIIRIDENRSYDWWKFLDAINNRIEKLTEQEDKKLGYWFVKPNKDVEISLERFVSKVVFYLWNDVFKDFAKDSNSPFVIKGADDKKTELRFKMFFDDNGEAVPDVAALFIEGLKVESKKQNVSAATSNDDAKPYDNAAVDGSNTFDTEDVSYGGDDTNFGESDLFGGENSNDDNEQKTDETEDNDLFNEIY